MPIKAYCDACGKDLGIVRVEEVFIAGPRKDDVDSLKRYAIPYLRNFHLRLSENKSEHHVVACSMKCAEALDKTNPKQKPPPFEDRTKLRFFNRN